MIFFQYLNIVLPDVQELDLDVVIYANKYFAKVNKIFIIILNLENSQNANNYEVSVSSKSFLK